MMSGLRELVHELGDRRVWLKYYPLDDELIAGPESALTPELSDGIQEHRRRLVVTLMRRGQANAEWVGVRLAPPTDEERTLEGR